MTSLPHFFVIFIKVGLFSFGGGLASLPLLYQSISEQGLMTMHEFTNLVAVSQIVPGPVMVNAATYAGSQLGVLGSVVSVVAVILPSFCLTLLSISFLKKYGDNKILKGVMCGIKPASIGLIATTIALMFANISLDIVSLLIIVATVIMSYKFRINPIIIIIIMGTASYFAYTYIKW